MVDLSRFRRRRDLLDPRFYDRPSRERHFFSIIGSVLSVVLLVVAMVLREWAKVSDTLCDYTYGLFKVYITHRSDGQQEVHNMSDFYKQDQQILVSCILSVSVLTILSSIVATIISLGYPREKMEFLRHYSVFNIVSLLCIVLVAGLWLAVVESLPKGKLPPPQACIESNHGSNTPSPTTSTDPPVSFGYCFYFLLVGGAFSLGGAAINLLFARSAADRRRSLRNRFRQRQSREAAAQRGSNNSAARDLTLPRGAIPPPYSALEEELTGGETTETSMSEPELSEQDEPISPPPPYVP